MPLKRTKGSGLTLSRMYHKSWILPVRVQVCQIDRINRAGWAQVMREYPTIMTALTNASPHQLYRYVGGTPAPPFLRTALQLPYRIILTSTDGQSEFWFVEDESEFTRLSKIFVRARADNRDDRVVNTIIEQHPV